MFKAGNDTLFLIIRVFGLYFIVVIPRDQEYLPVEPNRDPVDIVYIRVAEISQMKDNTILWDHLVPSPDEELVHLRRGRELRPVSEYPFFGKMGVGSEEDPIKGGLAVSKFFE